MPTTSQALSLAMQHHQAGRLQAAEQIYRQILAAEPSHADAIHLLGVIAHQSGNHAIAIEYIRRAIALNGNSSVFHVNLGNALMAWGNLDEAVESFYRALELKPNSAGAYNNLGNALKQQGNLDEAAACYRRVLELKPDDAGAQNNLGAIFKSQGNQVEAVACWRRALELNPNFADAHNNLGTVFKDLGRLDEAAACYRRALELNPDFAAAHNNLGVVLRDQGLLAEAADCCRRAVALMPTAAAVHNNLGNALKDLGRLNEAVGCYRRAIDLKPDYVEAHNNLGVALKEQGKLDEAAACCRRALQLHPDYAEAHNNLGYVLRDQGTVDEAVACYRRAMVARPDLAEVHSNLLYAQLFCSAYDAPALYEEHRRWNQRHAEPLAGFIQPHDNNRLPGRRLKIGYVSPDFRDHCQALFTLPLFTAHDHKNFEIVCYCDVLRPDAITERLRSYADTWRNIAGLSHEQVAALVRQDGIDILVDLTMHMARNRLLVFARKPAPVQVSWLAYPGTTGLSAIDYRITDPHLDPPGAVDDCYAEESIRLPDSFWCYEPLGDQPGVNALPAAEKGHITFGCLNNFCKVNPPVLRLWAEVLKAVDRSRITILAAEGSHRQHTLDLLGEEGVDGDRVTFVAFRPREKYLQLYHEIDIGLDTTPYNGHTTSLDSFWMGVPVVTLVGRTVVGRACLCQLLNLGLPELIASSPEQYVEIVAALAGDLARLTELRRTLRERMRASPLMDAPRFARNIEAAYREMWRRWSSKPDAQAR